MKTSILIKHWDRPGYSRESVPGEGGKHVPRYMKPHKVAEGYRSSDGATSWMEGEAVHTARGIHRPKSGKIDAVRIVHADAVEGLHKLDLEIEELQKQIAALRAQQNIIMDNAFASGKPLAIKQVKQWTEEADAARAAAKEGQST